jgi:toxin ParE1/3/4
MDYQVALSPAARRDLRDVVRYISLDSPERAVAFGQFLVSQAKRLAEFPELGRVVPEFGDASIREIVVRSYRVIYRVDHRDCRVEIIRFWHGARGTPGIQGP